MNALNIQSLLYLSFRLAPFILVSYFTMSSLFNQDFKGLIYLAGLLLVSFFCILVGNSFPSIFTSISADSLSGASDSVCNLMTISNTGPLSNLPLSLVVFTIAKFKQENQNIPTLVIFPVIILADIIWQFTNGCANTFALAAALIVSGLLGVAWASIIYSIGNSSLYYLNPLSNKESCSIPSKQNFKCTVKSK
jgi:hypothetical protein